MADKNAKKNRKIREKKSLIIDNCGDTVIIRNRSAVGGGILGVILMVFFITLIFCMRVAWSSLLFWVVMLFLLGCSAYWFVTIAFDKIVLNSPKKLITVYNPLRSEYKFEDINYIDRKSAKPKDGYVKHTVSVYIGKGNKRVRIETLSSAEAIEVESLLSGMLDNSAMEYPEGNEEPFEYNETKKKGDGILSSFKKLTFKKPEQKSAPDNSVSFVTKETVIPEKEVTEASAKTSDDELDRYNDNLIRRNK
jgi:hypothetical protein